MSRYDPSAFTTEYIPATTRKEGFAFVSSSWFYSKASLLKDVEHITHVNFTVLTDEQEQAFADACEPGDIRVGFETQRVPPEVTVIGIQVG